MEKVIDYIVKISDSGVLAQLNTILNGFIKLEGQTKVVDASIIELGKSLQTLSTTTLPKFRGAFDDVVKSQQGFIKTEQTKIKVLQELGKQAVETGKLLKENLSFSGSDMANKLTADVSSLTTALPAAIGAAIGGSVGGKAKIDIEPVVNLIIKVNKEEVEKVKKQLEEMLALTITPKIEIPSVLPDKTKVIVEPVAPPVLPNKIEAHIEPIIENMPTIAPVVKPHFLLDKDEIDKVRIMLEEWLTPTITPKIEMIAATSEVKKEIEDVGKSAEDTTKKLITCSVPYSGLPIPTPEQVQRMFADIKPWIDKGWKSLSEGVKKIFSSFGGWFDKIKKEGAESVSALGKTVSGLAGKLVVAAAAAAAAAVGAISFTKSIMNTGGEAEKTQKKLGFLFGSLDEGKKFYEGLEQYAVKTGISMTQLSTSAEKFALVAKGGPEEVQKMVEGAADIAAITGMSVEKATENIVRMWEGGSQASREFKNTGVLEMLGFQRGVDIPIKETQAKLKEAFADPSKRFSGMAVQMATTWEGLMGSLSGMWGRFKRLISDSGLFEYIKAAVGVLIDWFANNKESVDRMAKAIGETMVGAVKFLLKAFGYLGDVWQMLKMAWLGLKGAFVAGAEVMNKGLAWLIDTFRESITSIIRTLRRAAEEIAYVNEYWTGYTLGLGAISKKLYEIELSAARGANFARDNVKYWQDVFAETALAAHELAKEERYSSAIENTLTAIDLKMKSQVATQQKLNKELEANKAIQDKAREDEEAAFAAAETNIERIVLLQEKLSGTPLLRSQVALLKSQLDIQQKEIEKYYALGIRGLSEYFTEREGLLARQLEAETALLLSQAEGEENIEKKIEYYNKLEEAQATYNEASIKLEKERIKKEAEAAQAGVHIWAWYGSERRTQQQIEIDAAIEAIEEERDIRLFNLELSHDLELISEREYLANREAIIAESEKRIEQQREKSLEMWLNAVKTTAADIEESFKNLYEATGKRIKAFFYLMKAAAIVNTIISTYEGAQKAYTSLAGIPVVGPALGAAAAAVVVAGGLAKVAIISSQNLAKGGPVKGHSPSDTADNIPANLTAGEFVQPVSSVRYYGPAAMEAIRLKMVPREAFANYALSARQAHTRFAAGGLVAPTSQDKQSDKKQEINIVNILTQDQIDQYMASRQGDQAIINIISRNNRQVKAIMAQ